MKYFGVQWSREYQNIPSKLRTNYRIYILYYKKGSMVPSRPLWVLRATVSKSGNATLAHLLDDTESCQLRMGLRARKSFAAGPCCKTSFATEIIQSSRSDGIRGYADGKRCSVKFMKSPHVQLINGVHF